MASKPQDTAREPGPAFAGVAGVVLPLALVFASAAAIFTFWYLPRERAADIAVWSRDLAVRADLRREALTRHFEDKLDDALTVSHYPSGLLALDPSASPLTQLHVTEIFESFAKSEGDSGVVLWRGDATPVFSTRSIQVDAGCRDAARAVVASGAPAVAIHRHEGMGPLLTFTAPVRSPDGVTRGAATTFEDPRTWLYPFLSRPLSGTDTGEALLVAVEGDEVVALSPLPDRPDAPLTLRRPLGALGYGAREASGGSTAVVARTDYRGERVLATGRKLPPTPWILATKVNEAEVLKGFRADAIRTAASAAAFLLAASALLWGLAQRRERLQEGRASLERQRHEEAIRQSEERYRALFEGMRNGFAYCEMLTGVGPSDFRYLAVNRAFGELTGLKDVVGRRVSEVIPGLAEANPEIFAFYGRVAETGTPETLESYVAPLGIWFAVSAYSPRKGHFVAIFDNITERKEAEERLREAQQQLAQAQKMEAVGRLAGGVAHDFNNLLTVIRGYAELLAPALEKDPDTREEITEILRAAERAGTLTGQLLAFSRRQTLEMRPLDLRAAVTDTEKMLRRLIGEDIRLEVALPPALGRVNADRGQIEQVLMNLAVNARDAMPDGGPLRISLSETTVEQPLSAASGTVPPGRYVVLEVADEGIGMTPETLEHAFEPFYTTKAKGKGTGLGLATVYGIVKQSGGHVRVTSAPGEGTTIDLYFPRAGEEDGETPSARAAQRGGPETILITEDEAGVRDVAARFLARWGYRILTAESGASALALAEAEPGPIDLLLTDLVMPGMSGADLARALGARRAGLRVLFMSGYSHDVLERSPPPGAAPPLLRKPFTEADLVRGVREALDAPDADRPGAPGGPRTGSPA